MNISTFVNIPIAQQITVIIAVKIEIAKNKMNHDKQ